MKTQVRSNGSRELQLSLGNAAVASKGPESYLKWIVDGWRGEGLGKAFQAAQQGDAKRAQSKRSTREKARSDTNRLELGETMSACKSSTGVSRSGFFTRAMCCDRMQDSHQRDSNPRPAVYKTADDSTQVNSPPALTTTEIPNLAGISVFLRQESPELAALVGAWPTLS